MFIAPSHVQRLGRKEKFDVRWISCNSLFASYTHLKNGWVGWGKKHYSNLLVEIHGCSNGDRQRGGSQYLLM